MPKITHDSDRIGNLDYKFKLYIEQFLEYELDDKCNKLAITSHGYLNVLSKDVLFDDPIIKTLLSLSNNKLILSYNTHNFIDNIPSSTNILILALTDYTNVKIDNLPANLKELCISSIKTTNTGLLRVEFSHYFNSSIDYLPSTLENLVIESYIFNQSIDNLPSTLKVLYILSSEFTQSIDNLPQNLETLVILSVKYTITDIHNLPPTLEYIRTIENSIIDKTSDVLLKERPKLTIVIDND